MILPHSRALFLAGLESPQAVGLQEELRSPERQWEPGPQEAKANAVSTTWNGALDLRTLGENHHFYGLIMG